MKSRNLKYTLAALVVTTVSANAALTITKDYTSSGLDFTGVVNGALVWGMDKNPINNVGVVDIDANSTKDFHESGATAVDPSDGKASNTDGLLFRWDYGGSPSRAAGLETTNVSYTLEFGLDIMSTGTEGSRGVWGIAPEFTTGASQGRIQMEIGRTGLSFQGGVAANTVLSASALSQSNVGFHTWRIAYDATNVEMFIYRDGVLLNLGGVGIAGATDLGNPTITLFGDYSSGLGGDWELDYMAMDASGAFAPVPEPSSAALIGLAGLVFLRRRRK